ncbi:hypothetical protein K456DRAFT_1553716 [Colletotrichum gloeosporioides 23]|nr:hypothetical protein K456DRAFT_1553716 [Colletotrichum gloeosporioides 23]
MQSTFNPSNPLKHLRRPVGSSAAIRPTFIQGSPCTVVVLRVCASDPRPQTNHSTGPKACLASPRIVLRRRLFLGPASQSARLLFSSTRCIQSLFHPSHIRRSRSPAYYKTCLSRPMMSVCRLMTRLTSCLRGDASRQALGTRTTRRPCTPSASYQLPPCPLASALPRPSYYHRPPFLDRTTLQQSTRTGHAWSTGQVSLLYAVFSHTPPDPVIWHPTPPAHPSFSPTSLH